MTSKQLVFSCRTISKLTAPPPVYSSARHSTLKLRLGAVPVTEVKIPSFGNVRLSVRRSPWKARIAPGKFASGNGQAAPNGDAEAPKTKLPLEEAWNAVPAGKVVPKMVTGKGIAISVATSSPWLPMSVVPGTMALPFDVAVV